MKTRKLIAGVTAAVLFTTANAQNPVVQTWFTTDPAPMVHDGTMYIYTGHDEDGADFFWMNEWRTYSSQDMVNWRDHGTQMDFGTFKWSDDRAWAAQTIERNGKYYWYVCAHSKLSGGMAIGVAVSNSPIGPWHDALGKPIYDDGKWDNIDPTVFIDDDGQAYLYWGNPILHYGKLNEDMISFKGETGIIEFTEEGFGSPSREKRIKGKQYIDTYVEGPWIHHRKGGKYYMLYAAGGIPEHISYSESDTPLGPWKYRGQIMPQEDTKSFTNHCGVASMNGHDYFFYHTGKLPHGGGYGRSVAIEEFKYNSDGSFPTIHHTDQGVSPIATFNPFRKVEAETMAFSRGIKTQPLGWNNVYVSDIHNGDWIKLRNVAFNNQEAKAFSVKAASAMRGGTLELRADSIKGTLIASIEITKTGGWEKFKKFTTKTVNTPKGIHDIFLVFKGLKGPELYTLDWWEMK